MYSMTIKSTTNSTMMNSKSKQTKTLPKLSAGFKKRWVDALRSGNYIRHHGGKLYCSHTDSYSPIGVAFKTSGVPAYMLEDEYYLNDTWNFVPKELCGQSPIIEKINHLNNHKKMSFNLI
jgi:hypothetical protein